MPPRADERRSFGADAPANPLATCVTVVDPVTPGMPLTGYVCLVTAKSTKFRAVALALGGNSFPVPATK